MSLDLYSNKNVNDICIYYLFVVITVGRLKYVENLLKKRAREREGEEN
jgi:hypothetical protein